MRPILIGIFRVIETLTTSAGWLAAATTVPLALFMLYEVIVRYAFNAPTFWAYELGYMLMGAGLMLGIAYTMQMRAHVRVDFFYQTLSPRGQAAIDLIGYLILLPILLWLCVGLWDYLDRAYVSGERSGESAWNPVVWPFRVTFVAGFVLWVAQTVAEILKSSAVLFTGRPLINETRGEPE